jgi:hypothetical protein
MRLPLRLKVLVPAAGLLAAAAWVTVDSLLTPTRAVPEAVSLRAFVRGRPPVPVVFTSRTEPASFEAAAPEAEGSTYPGTTPWVAREGRLRRLDPDGKVYELTWGRALPDGGTLIDVMSPSVCLDGTQVLFAGRRAPPDAGRWRIYEVRLDGSGLRQLTGGPDDPGCVALPPLRFAAAGTRLGDAERRQLDYDDVDPTDLGPNGFAFASSRMPDLGRDHARRATQIWVWPPGEAGPRAVSANRNNDRWPVLLASDLIAFSLWSRNREAVTADRSDVRPVSRGGDFATAPADRWMAARVMANGAQVGYAVKSAEPVWRARPLFNGRLAFMTDGPGGRLRLAQADWGYIRSAPSTLPAGDELPNRGGAGLTFGPDRDAEGRELTAGCPAPCPGGLVVFGAAPVGSDAGGFGLYSVPEDWSTSRPVPQLLFDDPSLVDAEPVTAYPRILTPEPVRRDPPTADRDRPAKLHLADGREHAGPAGYVENLAVRLAIRAPIPWADAPAGERVDPRKDPLVPPPTSVHSVAFYASHRDRFDDPERPRVPGGWQKLLVATLDGPDGVLTTWVPSDPQTPIVLAGLDAEGKVAEWTGRDSGADGRPQRYLALAGDHYSGIRPSGYHYCNGCHAGHTFNSADIRERTR